MFALPVPAILICDFLGVARTERDGFEVPSRIIADIFGTTTDEKKSANRDLYAFTWRVIEEKRARPGDDLLSEVILTGDSSDDVLNGLVRLLFGASHHTTATTFAASAFFLLGESVIGGKLLVRISLRQTGS